LVELRRVEPPHAGAVRELGAGILAPRLVRPVGDLTGIRGRADVHEQRAAVGGECQVLGAVAADGQVLDDHVRGSERSEAARPHRVAIHGGGGDEVEGAFAERDTGAAFAADALLHVGLAVARGIPQGKHAPRARAPAGDRDEQVAVRRHRQVPGSPHLIGDDDGAEARGEGDAAVVGVARR